MLKPGSHLFNILKPWKNKKWHRGESSWIHEYPSPEPSFMIKIITRLGEKVYSSLERFFEGDTKKQSVESEVVSYVDDINSPGNNFVWELNQDMSDIVIKDIQAGLHYIIPPFIRKISNKILQYCNLYIQADVIVSEESANNPGFLAYVDNLSNNVAAKILIYKRSVEAKNPKLLLFSDWLKRRIDAVFSLQIRIPIRLSSFYHISVPAIYYSIEFLFKKIRGPDNFKLNPTLFFHKRI